MRAHRCSQNTLRGAPDPSSTQGGDRAPARAQGGIASKYTATAELDRAGAESRTARGIRPSASGGP
jgi:hypothetical protein